MKKYFYPLVACGLCVFFAVAIVFAVLLTVKNSSQSSSDSSSNSSSTQSTSSPSSTTSPSSTSTPPVSPMIYVTVVSHNEDTVGAGAVDYVADKDVFWTERDGVAQFAAMITKHHAAYDFQSDWNFLLGVKAYDDGDELTDEKNLLQYLDGIGVSIDPHSHEHLGYNYADVAYLMTTLGVTPSNVVGGFLASPVSASKVEYIQQTITGATYPSYQWTPEVAWGGGVALHQDESALWTSGVWRPTDNERFTTHDPDGAIAVIGHYNSDWTGLDRLLELQAAGELDAEKIYTVTIMTNQNQYTSEYIDAFEKKLLEYTDDVAAGRMTWATLPEVFTAWQTVYNETPSQLVWDGDETKSELSPSGNSSASSSSPSASSTASCGDGTCSLLERKKGICSADCL